MPTDVGIVDLMLSIPTGHEKDWYEFLKPQLREESKDYEFPVQYMFKDVPHMDLGSADPVDATLHLMDRYGIEKAMVGRGPRRPVPQPRRGRHGCGAPAPRPVHPVAERRPEPGHERRARPGEGLRDARHQGGHRVPGRLHAPGADQRQEVLSAVREVHRARHPDLRVHRRLRTPGAVGVPGDDADRRGLLVLPGAQVRDAPRCRAVGRRGRQAPAQVAEPLLLDQRVRAPVLPRRRSSTSPTPAAPTR